MNNEEQLKKLAQVFNADKLVTTEDVAAVLKGIMSIMVSFKKDNEVLTSETKEIVKDLLLKVKEQSDKLDEDFSNKTSKTVSNFEKSIAKVETLIAKVKTIKPKDGVDGKDADEESIIDRVMGKIKLPEYKETVLDNAGQIRDKLETLKEEDRLDASAIKNLPEFIERSPVPNGGGWRNLFQLHDVTIDAPTNDQVLKYNSTTSQWENGTGGGGAGTVTSVSVVTANGVSGTVATATTTPAITLTLGAITPTSVNGNTITTGTGTLTLSTFTLTVSGTASITGTNTGDQTSIVGITGTKSQFDTALTDGNFLYVGDAVTSVSGTSNRISSTGGTTPVIDIDAAYVGQTSITTLGTIATGTWNATTIGVTKGGTGVTSISAKSIWLANSANTITEVTPGAGQSIRINAGNTAWEAYTPGSGGGDVTKVGTPSNNQMAVWTGDGTLEGTSDFTYDNTNLNLITGKNFQIAGATVLADAAGTTTLSNIDALDATTEATIEAAIDTLANLTSIQGHTVTLTGAFIRSGAHSLTLTTTGTTNVTLPTTGTLATLAGTETLTNKRITERVQSVTDAATVTPNADSDDDVDITALAQAVTIANATGTPTNFQRLTIRILDDGTGRAITWGTAYVDGGGTLPATTTASKRLKIGFIYNTANALNKWESVALSEQP